MVVCSGWALLGGQDCVSQITRERRLDAVVRVVYGVLSGDGAIVRVSQLLAFRREVSGKNRRRGHGRA